MVELPQVCRQYVVVTSCRQLDTRVLQPVSFISQVLPVVIACPQVFQVIDGFVPGESAYPLTSWGGQQLCFFFFSFHLVVSVVVESPCIIVVVVIIFVILTIVTKCHHTPSVQCSLMSSCAASSVSLLDVKTTTKLTMSFMSCRYNWP